jgi:hypothetical protein
LQLIPTRGRKVLPASLPILPPVKLAFLEITLLGLRALTPSGLMKLQRPQVRVAEIWNAPLQCTHHFSFVLQVQGLTLWVQLEAHTSA